MPLLTHPLKVWPPYFDSILSNEKRFEIRKNDRDFKVGDILILSEWVNDSYTGRSIVKIVTYILRGGMFGIKDGYVALGIDDPFQKATETKNETEFGCGMDREIMLIKSIIDMWIETKMDEPINLEAAKNLLISYAREYACELEKELELTKKNLLEISQNDEFGLYAHSDVKKLNEKVTILMQLLEREYKHFQRTLHPGILIDQNQRDWLKFKLQNNL